jgi:arylsulfatase A-like enzyme
MKTTFLSSLVLLLVPIQIETGADRHNIIFLFADDQRADTIGKWHNGKGTLDKSFANGRSIYMDGMANHADFQVQDLTGGRLSPKRDAGGFSSAVFADEAVVFIQRAGTEQPFFLYVAFTAPHDPRNPPEKYRRMYYENRPPCPITSSRSTPFRTVRNPCPAATRDSPPGHAPRR